MLIELFCLFYQGVDPSGNNRTILKNPLEKPVRSKLAGCPELEASSQSSMLEIIEELEFECFFSVFFSSPNEISCLARLWKTRFILSWVTGFATYKFKQSSVNQPISRPIDNRWLGSS
jgi:hypothetical protein